jgi:hypothetical protein
LTVSVLHPFDVLKMNVDVSKTVVYVVAYASLLILPSNMQGKTGGPICTGAQKCSCAAKEDDRKVDSNG